MNIRMGWTGKRMAPRGHAICPCLTAIYCGEQCARKASTNNRVHYGEKGHQRYLLLRYLAREIIGVPGLETRFLRYLRVISGYEYGMMPVFWEY